MTGDKQPDELDFSSFVLNAGAKVWAIFLLALVAIVCLQWWSAARVLQGSSPSAEAFVTWTEQKGSGPIVAGYTLLLAGFTAGLLWGLDRMFHIFRLPKTHSFYWLRVTFVILVFSEIDWFGTAYISSTWFSAFCVRHPVYYAAVIRANCVTILLVAATGIYLLKQATKLVYGISEITVSVVSNLTLVRHIDISHAPKISVPTADAVAFVVFTYLLSRGISNLVEGIDEAREKKLPQKLEEVVPKEVMKVAAPTSEFP